VGRGAASSSEAGTISTEGLLHLSVVYVVWSSTYLAIRVAVREGSGFPPLAMVSTRLLLASGLLLALGSLSKSRVRPEGRELAVVGASGVLLWAGGNGLVTWAEQNAPSGYSALIVASAPIWVALMQFVADGRPPTPKLLAALAVGFAGVGILTSPSLTSGPGPRPLDTLALLLAAACWGAGSLLQSRNRVGMTSVVSSGYQQLFGGLTMALASLASGEPSPTPGVGPLLAWGYLVVFGSVLAFTSYVKALKLLPTDIAMTYAYVNPVLAVLLGAAILHEQVTGWTFAGMAFIVLGVAGVFREGGGPRNGAVRRAQQ